jgi:hypothetical protein
MKLRGDGFGFGGHFNIRTGTQHLARDSGSRLYVISDVRVSYINDAVESRCYPVSATRCEYQSCCVPWLFSRKNRMKWSSIPFGTIRNLVSTHRRIWQTVLERRRSPANHRRHSQPVPPTSVPPAEKNASTSAGRIATPPASSYSPRISRSPAPPCERGRPRTTHCSRRELSVRPQRTTLNSGRANRSDRRTLVSGERCAFQPDLASRHSVCYQRKLQCPQAGFSVRLLVDEARSKGSRLIECESISCYSFRHATTTTSG